jgi:putative transposase
MTYTGLPGHGCLYAFAENDPIVQARVAVFREGLAQLGWQRRFWEHAIRDDADLDRHIDYVHFKPVKHGLVTRVCDWPHSSFNRYVARGILPPDWGGDLGEITGAFGE